MIEHLQTAMRIVALAVLALPFGTAQLAAKPDDYYRHYRACRGVETKSDKKSSAKKKSVKGRIVFASNRKTVKNPYGDYEIYSIKAVGRDVRQLTDNFLEDTSPAYSPDGAKIAFDCGRTVDKGGEAYYDPDICLMDADGKNLVRLTTTNTVTTHPPFPPMASGSRSSRTAIAAKTTTSTSWTLTAGA